MSDDRLKQVAKHWAGKTTAARNVPDRIRWWQSPHLVKRINERVCGKPVSGPSQGLIEKVKQLVPSQCLPLELGVSIGGGTGAKEMQLVRQGLVSHFRLYELTPERIVQGRHLAQRWEIEDKVEFINGDAFEIETDGDCYDIVHWNNALHHMFDVHAAVKWSRDVLKKGGLFYMDDFVGATRFQWSDWSLQLASKIRSVFPRHYLERPGQSGKYLPVVLGRPDPIKLAERDPSEAADSEQILDAVTAVFPDAEISLTGGVVYHLALSDMLHNLDEEKDQMILDLLMIIDGLCADLGETHYATALAIK